MSKNKKSIQVVKKRKFYYHQNSKIRRIRLPRVNLLSKTKEKKNDFQISYDKNGDQWELLNFSDIDFKFNYTDVPIFTIQDFVMDYKASHGENKVGKYVKKILKKRKLNDKSSRITKTDENHPSKRKSSNKTKMNNLQIKSLKVGLKVRSPIEINNKKNEKIKQNNQEENDKDMQNLLNNMEEMDEEEEEKEKEKKKEEEEDNVEKSKMKEKEKILNEKKRKRRIEEDMKKTKCISDKKVEKEEVKDVYDNENETVTHSSNNNKQRKMRSRNRNPVLKSDKSSFVDIFNIEKSFQTFQKSTKSEKDNAKLLDIITPALISVLKIQSEVKGKRSTKLLLFIKHYLANSKIKFYQNGMKLGNLKIEILKDLLFSILCFKDDYFDCRKIFVNVIRSNHVKIISNNNGNMKISSNSAMLKTFVRSLANCINLFIRNAEKENGTELQLLLKHQSQNDLELRKKNISKCLENYQVEFYQLLQHLSVSKAFVERLLNKKAPRHVKVTKFKRNFPFSFFKEEYIEQLKNDKSKTKSFKDKESISKTENSSTLGGTVPVKLISMSKDNLYKSFEYIGCPRLEYKIKLKNDGDFKTEKEVIEYFTQHRSNVIDTVVEVFLYIPDFDNSIMVSNYVTKKVISFSPSSIYSLLLSENFICDEIVGFFLYVDYLRNLEYYRKIIVFIPDQVMGILHRNHDNLERYMNSKLYDQASLVLFPNSAWGHHNFYSLKIQRKDDDDDDDDDDDEEEEEEVNKTPKLKWEIFDSLQSHFPKFKIEKDLNQLFLFASIKFEIEDYIETTVSFANVVQQPKSICGWATKINMLKQVKNERIDKYDLMAEVEKFKRIVKKDFLKLLTCKDNTSSEIDESLLKTGQADILNGFCLNYHLDEMMGKV